MSIIYNNVLTPLPEKSMTIADLALWKKIPQQGTAIAVNDKLIKRDKWQVVFLNEGDRVTVITAAYGG